MFWRRRKQEPEAEMPTLRETLRAGAYTSIHAAFVAVIRQAEEEDAQIEQAMEELHVWTYKRYAAQAMLDALKKDEQKGVQLPDDGIL